MSFLNSCGEVDAAPGGEEGAEATGEEGRGGLAGC